MILDATAGNRTMWQTKKVEDIIYIDIEKKLKRKPTIFADCTNTPFLSETFDTIFYDPPQMWGGEPFHHEAVGFLLRRQWARSKPYAWTYYGWDKYKTRNELIVFIYRAQKEFQRILKYDGLLWLKWNECKISLNRILVIFIDWTEVMRLYVNDPTHTASKHQTYWICLSKKKKETMQTTLT
jgi:hypothetical protein